MRTGLVSIGDTKEKVLTECGSPTSGEIIGDQTTGSYSGSVRERRSGRYATSRGSYQQETRVVERWTYNCGDGDYIYVLEFVGGNVSTIESGGRGRGGSDCRGAEFRPSPQDSPSPSANERPFPPPPTQRPSAQMLGAISVFGTPHNSKVYLDGQYVGQMACTIQDVSQGYHQVSVESDGFRKWEGRIMVKAGETAHVPVYLEPQ